MVTFIANAKRDGNSVPTLIGVSSADGVTPVLVAVDPDTGRVLVDMSGGGISILTATGTVDDSNVDFVFASEPTVVVVNGAVYRKNRGWTWTLGTLTVTLASPAGSGGDVYGLI